MKRWFFRAFKASIVIGMIGFLSNAWDNLQRYDAGLRDNARNEIGYQCAARLSDEALATAANPFGNVDVSKLGCAVEPFFVSMDEVSEMRAGELDFPSYYEPFVLADSVGAWIAFFVSSMLMMTTVICSAIILRWVWK